ncbi:MAG: transcriptional regulator FtsR, partial [Pseudonocardiaceae bacterium]
MEDRAYLSIGEVLSLLKQEFPDVTISKIRFLESQGLLDPERTPSGYRKFYESDVDRLRWILRQQREHFLPLKVIKGRLRAGHEGRSEPVEIVEAVSKAVSSAPFLPAVNIGSTSVVPQSGVTMTALELAGATGLGEDDLRDLERFGLIGSRRVGANIIYGEEALVVAHLAAGFMKYGVEARHLRMYKTAGEREAGFFEQVVTPMVKQRNPEARRQAADAIEDLARLGEGLRAAMLRQA